METLDEQEGIKALKFLQGLAGKSETDGSPCRMAQIESWFTKVHFYKLMASNEVKKGTRYE